MSSINIRNVFQNSTVDFNSLREVANGKYNLGEVDAKFGKSGISFGKINNHVTNTGKNNVVRGEAENTRTNAAVFKAILDHYGRIDGGQAKQVADILGKSAAGNANTDQGALGEAFSRLSNPYIKEAFKFLMLDDAKGKPLSRDELKQLLSMLDGWEKGASQTLKHIGQKNFAFATKVAENMHQTLSDSMWMLGLKSTDGNELNALKELHSFKEKAKVTQADKDLVDEIAAYAYGSHEGSKGGEGYIGVLNGKVVKCLTHSGERANIGEGLPSNLRDAVNQSTKELREKLTALADKLIPRAEKNEIMGLLAENKDDITAHNGLDLLSRKAVAKVVTLLAKGAPGLFSWKGLEAADTVKDTSFAEVFKPKHTEEEIQNLTEISLDSTKGFPKYNAFIKLLTNPKARQEAAREVDEQLKKLGITSPITMCQDVDVSTEKPVADLKSQFSVSDEYTSPTVNNVVNQGTDPKNVCAQVFADGHFWGGGLGKPYSTQEESTLTDSLDPRVAAWMMEKGMIKLSNYNGVLGFEYTDKLSTAGGGYILNDPFNGKKFAFLSMPSLDIRRSYNHDILGNSRWMCAAERFATGQKATPQMEANAFKFVETFYKVIGKGDDFPVKGERVLESLAEYMIFARDYEHCNVFAHRRDEDVTKAVKDYIAYAAKQLAKNPEAFKKRAREGYEATISTAMAKMFRAAQNLGVKKFIGGVAGTGEFRNEMSAVADIASTQFRKQGGDMDYIYPAGASPNKIFTKAFGV